LKALNSDPDLTIKGLEPTISGFAKPKKKLDPDPLLLYADPKHCLLFSMQEQKLFEEEMHLNNK
jgi:hypothetical protein